MLDLRVLRDLWTEDGARSVFARLVTHCVKKHHPSALSIRPNPGDEGVDTLVGDFGSAVRVYQAKFFCDGVGESQQRQIRESWRACTQASYFSRLVQWTLCLPIELSTDEVRWWQGWKKRQQPYRKQIEIWTGTKFEAFRALSDLKPVFDFALKRVEHQTVSDVLRHLLIVDERPILSLPLFSQFADAIFVKKIEAAGIRQHRAARTAFYNFELLRQSIAAGGTVEEQRALEDLQNRIFDLWEQRFNEHAPDRLGRALYNTVNSEIATEDNGRLRCDLLGTHAVHKKGGLHYWADNCHAGWTADFEDIGRQDPRRGDH
jgi:hypothetical protein